jgi:hypothetical protein
MAVPLAVFFVTLGSAMAAVLALPAAAGVLLHARRTRLPRGALTARLLLILVLAGANVHGHLPGRSEHDRGHPAAQLVMTYTLPLWPRWADVDDVLLNVLGVIVGWTVWRLTAGRRGVRA